MASASHKYLGHRGLTFTIMFIKSLKDTLYIQSLIHSNDILFYIKLNAKEKKLRSPRSLVLNVWPKFLLNTFSVLMSEAAIIQSSTHIKTIRVDDLVIL